MKSNRLHLAAILKTDLQTGQPEAIEANSARTRRLSHTVLTEQHHVHFGRLVNQSDGGSVSVFDCTLNAVRCASAIQKEFCKIGERSVRMCVHVGEVLDASEDISGACVQLAEDIQALAPRGSILLTDIVYAQIRNQSEFKVLPLGRFTVHGTQKKIRIYALIENNIVVPSRTDLLRKHRRLFSRTWAQIPVQINVLRSRLVFTHLT